MGTRGWRKAHIRLFAVAVLLCLLATVAVEASVSVFWKYPTGAEVERVCFSADGSYVAALVYRGLFDADILLLGEGGNLLWNKSYSALQGDISISISGDASSVAILEKDDCNVSLFNREGQILWKKRLLDSPAYGDIEISSDGRYIIAGDGQSVALFNITGDRIWKQELNASVYQVSVSSSGERIAACTNDEIYFLDDRGMVLWSYKLNMSFFIMGEEKMIGVSPNGDYLVAALYGPTSLLCLDGNGRVSWSKENIPRPDSISVSQNRIALTQFYGLVFLNGDGTQYSAYSSGDGDVRFKDVAISADGKFACTGGSDGCIRFLEILKSVALRLTLDKGDWQIIPGETLSVSISLDPPVAGADITLTYTKPDGTVTSKSVETSANGTYVDNFAPDAAGNWTMKAAWLGDVDHWEAESMETLIVGGYPIRIGEEAKIKVYGSVSMMYDYHVVVCPKFMHYGCGAVFVIGGSSYVNNRIEVYPSAKTGVYYVEVSGEGIPGFRRKIEVLPPINKYDTQVTISLPKNETASGSNVTVNGVAHIRVEGNLTAFPGLEVTLNYQKPDGETFTRIVTTDGMGGFSDTPTLFEDGVWKVAAIIPNDYARNMCESETLTFTVMPSVFAPSFSIYYLLGVVVSAVVISLAVIFRWRALRKRRAKSDSANSVTNPLPP